MAKPTGPLNLKEVVACQPLLFVCVGGGRGRGKENAVVESLPLMEQARIYLEGSWNNLTIYEDHQVSYLSES